MVAKKGNNMAVTESPALEASTANGGVLGDPNDWLTEADIMAIIGRQMTAGDEVLLEQHCC
jgi:hypothetical protein